MKEDALYGYDILRWGVVFVNTDTKLSCGQRGYIIHEALAMFCSRESEREIKT
ncbi:MAG: hypothetical protein AABW64_03175 [Nanoarchaeota archaeon]